MLYYSPDILKELAKRGNVSCKKGLNDRHRTLQKRNSILNDLLVREVTEGDGDRFVYDAQNRTRQRVALVRKEGDAATGDESVDNAYETSGLVRDYFIDTFALNSIDDNALDVISNVHYGRDYNNAFWDGDETTYGEQLISMICSMLFFE